MNAHVKLPQLLMADDDINRRIGERARAARLFAGISQQQMAALLGVTFQQVQKCEKGKNRMGPEKLIRWAAATDKPVEWFFQDVIGTRAATTADVIATIAADHHFGELAKLWLGLPRPARELLAEQGRMLANLTVTLKAEGR
ncbi:helix-turn-helix domain-containing protein [Ancylobacter oerskovii]|uniref:Helix-turn-helix domain-containing protein n=1 Tax=Ancylobacter oerskovii TaxID=459519 RepID=A0ABW4YR85_9HYPH|nr:helix-turn-helix transcriptional regulator [Ancylobacter oerskovii]MBS7545657.1 helix-turn-helix transcriptional regulator [Ancylobacter oerskovii]